MAKKNYTGIKASILGLSAAALMFGTAWLSQNNQPAASTTSVDSAPISQQPGSTNTSPSTPQAAQAPTTTPKPVAATKAKKSRAS